MEAVLTPNPSGERVPDELYARASANYDDKAMWSLTMAIAHIGFFTSAALIAKPIPGMPPAERAWSAFYGTDLDLQLRRRGVTQLVLAGIATSIGVESTARAAYQHGNNVALVADAMTDRDVEARHHRVERIFPLLGESGSTAEIIGLLAKTRA